MLATLLWQLLMVLSFRHEFGLVDVHIAPLAHKFIFAGWSKISWNHTPSCEGCFQHYPRGMSNTSFFVALFIIGITLSDFSVYQTPNREFLLRVSYLEIYNEVGFPAIYSLFLVTLFMFMQILFSVDSYFPQDFAWKEIFLMLLCSSDCYSQSFLFILGC